MGKDKKINGFLYYNLTAMTDGESGSSVIEGLAPGTFIDMYGLKLTVAPEELPEFVKNTNELIDTTKDSSGNVVGLPIDTIDHDSSSGAAGWIVGAEHDPVRQRVKLSVKWNDVGKHVIGDEILRYFSPTVIPASKVLTGGSLTNWPASRTAKELLLRPVELSEGKTDMFQLVDGSYQDLVNEVQDAFIEKFNPWFVYDEPWPGDVYEDSLIVYWGEKTYLCTYTRTDNGLVFQAQEEWVEKKLSYVDAALSASKAVRKAAQRIYASLRAPQAEKTNPTEVTMGEENKTGNAQAAPAATEPAATTPDIAALTAALTGAKPEQLNNMVNNLVNQRFEAALAGAQHKDRVAKLSQQLTGGTEEAPAGLPIKEDEINAFFMSLSPEQLDNAEKIFTEIRAKGLVPFEEMGHRRDMSGNKQLPDYAKALLKGWVDGGNTVEEFFKANQTELGEMAAYNLAEFRPDAGKAGK
jgi:hypothetical protein